MTRYGNTWLLVLLIITGVVLGGLIGNFLGGIFPVLSYGPGSLGLKDFKVDLGILYIQMTFLFNINVSALFGLILAVLIFNRL